MYQEISKRPVRSSRGLYILILTLLILTLAPLTAQAKTTVIQKTVYVSKGYSKTLSVKGKNRNYKWKTKSKKKATVSASGKITGKKKGTTTVTATSKKKKNKVKYIFTVVVENPKLSQSSMKLETGASAALHVATGQKVTWSSSKKTVASVSGGTVRAVGTGTATITAKVGGKKKLKCKVTVVTRDWTKDKNGDGLPDYWDTHAEQKVSAIRSRALSIGSSGLQFLFVTDFHSPSNRLLSVPLVHYVARNTGIRTVVNGGDLIDKNHSKADALNYLSQWNSFMSGLSVFNVRGNHDANAYPEGRSSSYFISDQEYYSMMIAGRGYQTTDGKLYYYKDDVASKTRIIVLDTGSPAEPAYKYVMKPEQKEWLENLLVRKETVQEENGESGTEQVVSNVPEGWHVVILQHAFYNFKDRSIATLGTYSMSETEMSILSEAKKAGVDIVGIFCGHSHRDYVTVRDGIPVICTMCDAVNQTKSLDPLHINRKWETIEEQAFDAVQIDYTARKIYLTRVGCGSDRVFSF